MEAARSVEPISGIILAGGQSRRMGRNKALLLVPGIKRVTFVEHLIALLAPLCAEVLLVARDQQMAAAYAPLTSARIVIDQMPGFGPLMGLYSGLQAIRASHALVLAVDMPFAQSPLLAYLLSLPRSDALIVPVVNGVPQVLFAIYPRSVLPLIEARLQAGRRDPRSLLEIAPVTYLDEEQLRQFDPTLRSFVGVNTLEDLSKYSGPSV